MKEISSRTIIEYAKAVRKFLILLDTPGDLSIAEQKEAQRHVVKELTDEILNAL